MLQSPINFLVSSQFFSIVESPHLDLNVFFNSFSNIPNGHHIQNHAVCYNKKQSNQKPKQWVREDRGYRHSQGSLWSLQRIDLLEFKPGLIKCLSWCCEIENFKVSIILNNTMKHNTNQSWYRHSFLFQEYQATRIYPPAPTQSFCRQRKFMNQSKL